MMRTVLLAALGVLIAGSAAAQVSIDDNFSADLRRDRQRLGPETPPEPGSPKDFEIALTAPLLFTDNALQSTAGDDRGSTARGDAHFNPDLFARWSHQFPSFKVSAAADASVDRFFTETDEDEDTLFGSLKLSLTDGRSAWPVPYLAYTATADFRPDFAERDDVLHSFFVGTSGGVAFDSGWRRIPLREAVHAGDRSIAFDVSAGRRLADPRDFENSFAILAVDFFYTATSDWTFGFTPKFRVRWYDDFEGEFRRDLRLSGILRAAWTPPWLTRLVPAAEIDFTIGFLKNFSTLARERFSQWEGGPALVLAWRF